MPKILLGFSVPKGDPVYIPLHHLAVFGMTQLSGKTTTLEGLISRSGLKAIAFKTKRGEAGFHSYREIQPYYRPRSDWQFVEGLVNVVLQEKVKYEAGMRSAIMKACEGMKDLGEVQQTARHLSRTTRSGFMRSVYERLAAYLDIVIPELAKWTFSQNIGLVDGVNVMDLTGMRLETQQLVIGSTIEYVYANLSNVVVIIPEAWEMIPELRVTPVKLVAEQFIRKGASVSNYLWIDSQDIGGVSKVPLRQCDNWLMGRMKEAHEVERILKQLLGLKISKEEIQTLPLGHFFAVVGDKVTKTYVLPTGVPPEVGEKVAKGLLSPNDVSNQYLKPKGEYPDLKSKEEIRREFEEMMKGFKGDVSKEIDLKIDSKLKNLGQPTIPVGSTNQKLTLNLEHREVIVNISHTEKPVDINTDTIVGKIVFAAVKHVGGEKEFGEEEISTFMKEYGWNIGHNTLAPSLANAVDQGYLIRNYKPRPNTFRLPKLLKINLIEKGVESK